MSLPFFLCTPDPQLQPQLSNQQFISLQIAIFLAKATDTTLNLNTPMNSHRLHPLNIMSFERTKNLSWNRTTFPRIMSTCSLKRKQIMGSETGGILTNNCCYYPRGKKIISSDSWWLWKCMLLFLLTHWKIRWLLQIAANKDHSGTKRMTNSEKDL